MTMQLHWEGRTQAIESIAGLFNAPPEVHSKSQILAMHEAADSQHRLIAGDNLDVMAHLHQREAGTFDFVYADPPYNSGQNFTYSDKGHSRKESHWACFMYTRFSMAHSLLSSAGVLCVSIDDGELPVLSMLLREIFGEENHIATIKWRKKRKPSFLDSHFSNVFEYILVFAKSKSDLPRLLGEKSSETTRPVLNQGNGIVERVIPKGAAAKCANVTLPAGMQGVRTLKFELLEPLVVEDGKVLKSCRVKGPFRVNQQLFEKTVFVTRSHGLRRNVLESELKHRHMTDDGTNWPTNEDADKEQMSLFGERVFQFAKPTGMLQRLLRMYPAKTESPKCLDFFAGSGSFGEAVLKENAHDGKDRLFTLIQSEEKCLPPLNQRFDSIFELMATRIDLAKKQLRETSLEKEKLLNPVSKFFISRS